MREIILKRIEEIKTNENGFPSSTTSWRNFSHGETKTHLRDIDFQKLNDTELLFLFERLIRRLSQMMQHEKS